MEHGKKSAATNVISELSTPEFTDMFPLDRASDDYSAPEDVGPFLGVKQEDDQDMNQQSAGEYDADVKQEPADDYSTEDPRFIIQVRAAYMKTCLCILW